jgi:PKD repeat protein
LIVWDVFTTGSPAGNTEDLQVSSRSGAGSFSTRINLEDGTGQTSNQLVPSASAVLDTSGAATIVWYGNRGAIIGALRAVTAPRAGGYAFPVNNPATIAPPGSEDVDPELRALSTGGVAGVASFHNDTGIQPIVSSTARGGLTLGMAFGTAADEENLEYPVADASGDLLVVASGTNGISHVFAYDATPPVAATITAPATVAPGTAATLSSSATDALTGVTVTWDFGDGQTATGASVAHVWATPGVYTVTATATDGASNTSAAAPVSVTVAAPAPRPPPAPAPLHDTTAPVITSASLTHTSFAVGSSSTATARAAKAKAKPKKKAKHKRKAAPKGTTIAFTLSETAKVTLTFTHSTPGTKSGKTCRVTTKKVAKAKRCTATVTDGKLTRAEKAGKIEVAFSGRIGRTALKVGKHPLSITATDAAGNTSHPKLLHLTIVKA